MKTTTIPSHALQEVRGKRVLELGCGVGLPGVAAAVVGATEVILTDMVRLGYHRVCDALKGDGGREAEQ